jgi:hypothetical protein
MLPIPTHRERQFMQRLRGRSWVKAFELPEAQSIMKHLLEKRWIESQGAGKDLSYRITEAGLDAKKAPIPLRRR